MCDCSSGISPGVYKEFIERNFYNILKMFNKFYTFLFSLLSILVIINGGIIPEGEETMSRVKRQHHGWGHHGWRHHGGWYRPHYYHHYNPYWGHHHGPWWW
uniref:Uncharacterized protein n=1 Tax=Strongyloides venezuelensis TaxID=75913 RepID=A0A0K0FDI9_STRVS